MEAITAETDEKDLERMFAEARAYPLLTAEQEREIDGRKWDAVYEIQAILLATQGARHYLRAWAENCLHTPVDISHFTNREHHFILRREVADYLEGGKRNGEMQTLVDRLAKRCSGADRTEALNALNLPASLTVGLAGVLLRKDGAEISDSVADALQAWERHWRRIDARPAPQLTDASRRKLKAQLRRYNDARDTLTMHNLRLVYSIAGKHRGKGVNFLDLVQEGTLGLIRAAEKYEHAKGFRFSTYCFNWITQAVRRYVGDSGGLIRYPTHVQEQVSKLYRIRLNETAITGEEPGDEQLAKAAGMTVEKTRSLLQLRNLGVSLDAPLFDDEDDGTLLDSIPGGPFEDTAAGAENESLHERLLEEITDLEPAERQVVIARWGLHEGPPLTRAEIADRMSVSREWVRQLERSALTKLSRNQRVQDAYEDYGAAL